jgi:hypothetical protein
MQFLDNARARRTLRRAAALRRGGDSPAAIDVLAPFLAAHPDHVGTNAEMARALRVLGDPSGAEEHLRAALGRVLDYTLVVELAASLAEQQRIAEAEALLDSALFMTKGNPRLDPGEALLVRATIAYAQDRDEDARAALDAIHPKRASRQTKAFAERLRGRLQVS